MLLKRLLAPFVAGLAVLWLAYALLPPPHQAQAQYADQGTWGGTSGGTANAQTITIPNYFANRAGVVLRFIPGNTNSGPTTLSVNGLGAIAVQRPSSIGPVAFAGKEFWVGEPTCVVFNGSVYVLGCNVDLTPIGAVKELRGVTTAPRGYMIEDGSCVSTTTYASLNSLIGGLYGSCSAGLFALPRSNGRALYAYDNQGVNGAANVITNAGSGCANATTVGGKCGAQNQTVAATYLPASGLSVPGLSIPSLSASVSTSGGGSIPVSSGPSTIGSLQVGATATTNITPVINSSLSWLNPTSLSGSTGTGTTGTGTTGNMGSGTAMPILPPADFVLRVIKY